MPVTRPARFNGLLAWLCLASGALALPLSAEEITVTVPPDPAPQAATANPAPAAPLPSFTAGGLQTSAADSDAADQGSAATSPPAAAPEPATTVVVPKAKKKAPATAQAEPTPAAEAPADKPPTDTAVPAKPAATPAAKPKVKQAAKPSPCKGLEEAACGGNKACKWTAPAATPDASGKVATPHCSSVASVKKKRPAKAAAPEVLPWAPKTTAAPPAADGSAALRRRRRTRRQRKLKPRLQKRRRRSRRPRSHRLFRRVRTAPRLRLRRQRRLNRTRNNQISDIQSGYACHSGIAGGRGLVFRASEDQLPLCKRRFGRVHRCRACPRGGSRHRIGNAVRHHHRHHRRLVNVPRRYAPDRLGRRIRPGRQTCSACRHCAVLRQVLPSTRCGNPSLHRIEHGARRGGGCHMSEGREISEG